MSRGFNSRYRAADATQSVWKAAQVPASRAWVVSGRIRPFDWVFPQLRVFGGECSLFGFAGCDSDLRQRSQGQADRASEGHHVILTHRRYALPVKMRRLAACEPDVFGS